MRIVIDLLIVSSFVFALAGVLGLIKMPDTFCRMQASTCVSTLGILGLGIAGILYAALVMQSAGSAIKIAVIVLLVLTVNPVGGHAIAKGAYQHGIRPEKEMKIDDYRRDFDD